MTTRDDAGGGTHTLMFGDGCVGAVAFWDYVEHFRSAPRHPGLAATATAPTATACHLLPRRRPPAVAPAPIPVCGPRAAPAHTQALDGVAPRRSRPAWCSRPIARSAAPPLGLTARGDRRSAQRLRSLARITSPAAREGAPGACAPSPRRSLPRLARCRARAIEAHQRWAADASPVLQGRTPRSPTAKPVDAGCPWRRRGHRRFVRHLRDLQQNPTRAGSDRQPGGCTRAKRQLGDVAEAELAREAEPQQ
jgi:hypothetical protein